MEITWSTSIKNMKEKNRKEERDSLIKEIIRVFESNDPPVSSEIWESKTAPTEGIIEAFSGKAWSDIDDSIIEHYKDDYVHFTDRAFKYFFPAYLVYSLNHLTDDSLDLEYFVFTLTPWNDERVNDWKTQFVSNFTKEERSLVCHFLLMILENEELHFNSGEIKAGIEIWRV